jgi:hypothetical protein
MMRNSRSLKILALSTAAAVIAARPLVAEHQPTQQAADCLPAGIRLSDVAELRRELRPDGSTAAEKPITVAEKLKQLGASCDANRKLVDTNSRPIVFYRLSGCWGKPPPDYQQILQKERAELDKLQKEHTVITMTCNSSGARIP